jgi:FhuF 2Fe-2S C-terminal domain
VTVVEPAPDPEADAVRAALAAAAQAGPFFRLEVTAGARQSGWLPVLTLSDGALAGLTAQTARQLGTGERRVAASVLHLGLAARLWSPVLGCVLLRGVLPDLDTLLIGSDLPGRFALADRRGSAGWLPGAVAETVRRPLAAIEQALPAGLPAGLLRGNSASAMAGALRVLIGHDPGLAAPAAELARTLLRTGALRGAGTFTGAGGLAYRRRSCCLYYRVPGGGLCGDCCLAAPPRSRN